VPPLAIGAAALARPRRWHCVPLVGVGVSASEDRCQRHPLVTTRSQSHPSLVFLCSACRLLRITGFAEAHCLGRTLTRSHSISSHAGPFAHHQLAHLASSSTSTRHACGSAHARAHPSTPALGSAFDEQGPSPARVSERRPLASTLSPTVPCALHSHTRIHPLSLAQASLTHPLSSLSFRRSL
jgi:hypothetical protein